ncbi:MAG: GWxTD domain-containing protein [Bacteroidota bacterium]
MVFVIIFLFTAFNPSENITEQGIYDRGLAHLERGDINTALDTWAEAKYKLNKPSLIIGFSFLEQATKHKLKSRYTQATDMYFWGLEEWNTTLYQERREQELSYLRAILSEEEIQDLESFTTEHADLKPDWIQQFWVAQDPVSTTKENERLLEHWERIAYARETFTESSESVFGTDERGDYYVRYGRPDQLLNGSFELTFNRLLFLLRLKLDANQLSYETNYGVDVDAYNRYVLDFARLYEQEIFRWYGESRDYELWIYENDDYTNAENTVMFGKDYSGKFRHLYAPDEMIHPTLFTASRRFNVTFKLSFTSRSLRINPAQILQFYMYERLSETSFVFKDAFLEIENRFAGGRYFSKNDSYIYRDLNLSAFKENRSRFEYQFSSITEDLPKLAFDYRYYRVIRDGKPAVLLAQQIHSGEQIFADMTYNYPDWFDESKKPLDSRLFEYELKSGIQILDKSSNLKAYALVNLDVDSVITKNSTQSNVFEFPVLEHSALKLIAQLNNHTEGTQPVTQTVLPNHFRAYNEHLFELNLAPDLQTEQLELSDIVVGFKLPHQEYDRIIPFTVSTKNTITTNQTLNLHFEVYKLTQNEKGLHEFAVQYSYKKKKNRIRGLFPGEKGNQYSLTYTSEHPEYYANLEIKLDRLEPGDYELELVVTDLTNGKTVTRTTNITAVKGN